MTTKRVIRPDAPLKLATKTRAAKKKPDYRAAAMLIEARAKVAQEKARLVDPFAPPAAWPNVVPDNAVLAQDEDPEFAAQALAFAYNDVGRYGEGLTFLGYATLAELAQRPEYRRAHEIMAEEMMRKGFKLVSASDEDKSTRIKILNDKLKDFDVMGVLRQLAQVDAAYGRANLYIDLGDLSDEAKKAPLIIDKATIGFHSLRAFRVVEPFWTYPARYNTTDPTAANFYQPQSWYCMGKELHGSRFIPFVLREVPDILKPAYAFGGLSLSQMGKPYVDNWIRTRQSVSDLVESFSVSGVEMDLESTLMGGSAEELDARIALYNAIRSTRGMMALNMNTEKFFNISTPLSTLDKLQAQAQEQMCSVWGIPLVKYTGITPSGLNASTDGELATFADTIAAAQTKFYDKPLKTILDVIMLSELGEIDPDIAWTWEPLKQMTESERATLRKQNADTAKVYMDSGVIDAEEERKRLAFEEDGLYQGLDPNDLPEPEQAPAPPQMGPDGQPLPPQIGPDGKPLPPAPGGPPSAPGGDDPEDGNGNVIPFSKKVAADLAFDAEWDEGDHKRGKGGQFAKSSSMKEALHPANFASEVTKKYLGAKHKVVDAKTAQDGFDEGKVKRDKSGKFAKSAEMKTALHPDNFASEQTKKFLAKLHAKIELAHEHDDTYGLLKTIKEKTHEKYGKAHAYLDALIQEHDDKMPTGPGAESAALSALSEADQKTLKHAEADIKESMLNQGGNIDDYVYDAMSPDEMNLLKSHGSPEVKAAIEKYEAQIGEPGVTGNKATPTQEESVAEWKKHLDAGMSPVDAYHEAGEEHMQNIGGYINENGGGLVTAAKIVQAGKDVTEAEAQSAAVAEWKKLLDSGVTPFKAMHELNEDQANIVANYVSDNGGLNNAAKIVQAGNEEPDPIAIKNQAVLKMANLINDGMDPHFAYQNLSNQEQASIDGMGTKAIMAHAQLLDSKFDPKPSEPSGKAEALKAELNPDNFKSDVTKKMLSKVHEKIAAGVDPKDIKAKINPKFTKVHAYLDELDKGGSTAKPEAAKPEAPKAEAPKPKAPKTTPATDMLKKGIEANLGSVLEKNKPAVEQKMAEIAAAIDDVSKLTMVAPIAEPHGLAQKKVNEYLYAAKIDTGAIPPPPPPPPKPSAALTPNQQVIADKIKAEPPKVIHDEHEVVDASGKPIKSIIKASSADVPGDWYAKVTAKLEGDHTHGPHIVKQLDHVMGQYETQHGYGAKTSIQKKKLSQYQDSACYSMNKAMNSAPPMPSKDSDLGKNIQHIKDAINGSPIPTDLPVWRGINASFENITGFKNPQDAVGKGFVHKSFASVSRSVKTSSKFAKGKTMLKFTVPAGTKGVSMEGQSGGEREIILDSHSMFRIDKVETNVSSGYSTINHLVHVTYLGRRADVDDAPEAPNGKGGAKPKAAPTPTPGATPSSMSGLTKVGGKLGSNPGGQYTDAAGQTFYVKESKSNDHAENEVLASKLYQLAGAPVIDVNKIDLGNGKIGTVTKWQDHEGAYKQSDQSHVDEVNSNLAVHAWLGNWDALGTGHDNQVKIGGKFHTVDVGGALKYRAQGAEKDAGDWTDDSSDLDNMKKYNPSTFGKMTPEQLKAGAAKIAAIPNTAIAKAIADTGMNSIDQTALYTKLITRKKAILVQAGLS